MNEKSELNKEAVALHSVGYVAAQLVVAAKDIWNEADDYSPSYLCASAGDLLEVREVGSHTWHYYVAHPHREKTAMFGVNDDEIKPHNSD